MGRLWQYTGLPKLHATHRVGEWALRPVVRPRTRAALDFELIDTEVVTVKKEDGYWTQRSGGLRARMAMPLGVWR